MTDPADQLFPSLDVDSLFEWAICDACGQKVRVVGLFPRLVVHAGAAGTTVCSGSSAEVTAVAPITVTGEVGYDHLTTLWSVDTRALETEVRNRAQRRGTKGARDDNLGAWLRNATVRRDR